MEALSGIFAAFLAEHHPVSKGVLMVAVACAIATTTVRQGLAVDGSLLASWLAQRTATGTWGGARDELELRGVTVELGYAADVAGNVSGGDRRGSGYAGFAVAGLGVDLEKLVGLHGWALTLSGLWASGRNLSEEDIGNLFAVQDVFAPGDVYLGQLALSQSLLDDTVTLQAGRLFAGDVFATSPLWNYYVSGGINANLNSISSDIFFPVMQVAAWGARVFYQPTKEWGFIAGGYNADPTVAAPSKHGVDFSLDMSKGALAIAQVTYSHNQSRDLTGLPGSVTLGGYYARGRFPQLDDPSRTERGNYGLYLYFDQMLFRGDWLEYLGPEHLRADASYAVRGKHPYIHKPATPKDRAHGLTVWGAIFVAPREAINQQMVQVAGGLLYHGMFPGRDHDVTAVGVISGIFSDRLPRQGAETVIEVNHRFQLARWFYVTPDFQYVIHPNGLGSVGSAAVFAGEIAVAF
jgi:porin